MKREFPPTQWTLICRAQDTEGTDWQTALGQLCELYWYPVYAQIRFRGRTAHEAEDLTQSFFAALLEREDLGSVDQGKGKFRSFLLGALNHFLANDYRKQQAKKRGGDRVIVSLDQALAEQQWREEPHTVESPQRLYEITWARTLLQTSLRQLEQEYGQNKQSELFAALRERLISEPSPAITQAMAKEFDMSDGAVRLTAFRMRKRLAKILQEEILQTLGDPGEVDEEISYLMTLFEKLE